jgi:hypothetical protein
MMGLIWRSHSEQLGKDQVTYAETGSSLLKASVFKRRGAQSQRRGTQSLWRIRYELNPK